MATRDEKGRVVLSSAESYHYELLKIAWADEGLEPWRTKRAKKKMYKDLQLIYLAVEGLVENG